MKKLIKGILILIGVIILTIIVGAVALVIAVRDTSDRTIPAVREANLDLSAFLHREAVKTLDGADERSDLSLLLNEYEMNELLFAIASDTDIPMVRPVGAYAAYGEDGALSVEIPLRVAGIAPTCIKGTLKVTYTDQVMALTVANASIGRFDCTSGLIRTFFLNAGNEKRFQKQLEAAGFHGKLDLRSLSLTMTSAEIAQTVSALTEDDPNHLLYALLCDISLNSPDILEFSFGENRLYGVILHADHLAYDPARDGELSYPLDLDSAAANTQALSENGLTRENVYPVFHYYTSGYRTLNDSEKAAVDALGLPENGLGVRTVTPLTMAEVLADQSGSLVASILNRAVTLTVSEQQMNTILAGLNIIGSGAAFYYDGKVAYLALEDIDVVPENRALAVTVVLNVGGKRLCGHISADCPDSDRMALDAEITELRLGEKVMSSERTSLFLQYLDGVLASQNWICADAQTETLTIDLGAVLTEQSEFAALLRFDSTIAMQCRKTAGNGQLQLLFHLI